MKRHKMNLKVTKKFFNPKRMKQKSNSGLPPEWIDTHEGHQQPAQEAEHVERFGKGVNVIFFEECSFILFPKVDI